ncbi:hypothetical protein LAZ67_14003516 [Cordylochernes scorpioides]|uniref:Uncharacterized protein n=1 Tax=Cordylochernes scorpioides TaxID=51811 RepID=A0ABY6LCI1_9ARAC|nr:hypothetical protein LAZ67_14003516 [Cordylochernes scorpioides]
MSCEVKFNELQPENPDGFSKTITATNSPRIQSLRGQKTSPGNEYPGKTITSGDVFHSYTGRKGQYSSPDRRASQSPRRSHQEN